MDQKSSDQAGKPAKEENSTVTSERPKVFKDREKQRTGRGYSREELTKAGTNIPEALRFKMPVDSRRKTCHDMNVEAAKTVLAEKKAAYKPKGKPKK